MPCCGTRPPLDSLAAMKLIHWATSDLAGGFFLGISLVKDLWAYAQRSLV